MFCPNCGAAVEADAPSCRSCGRALTDDAPPPPPPSGQPYEPYPTTPAPPSPSGAPYVAQGGAFTGTFSNSGLPLATWWQRVGAMVLDVIVLAIPFGVLSAAFRTRTTANGVTTTHHNTSFTLLFIVVSAVYFAVQNGTGQGQTIGNRVPGIAVRDMLSGEVIGFGRGLLRWFVRGVLYVLVLPGIVNDLWPLWDAQRQTLADKAARTVVVKVR